MELTKKYLINGPNNIVRLTNGDKILYIFGDFHFSVQNQNECPIDDDHDSIDIDKLLFKFMKLEKNREFDMFIEMFEYLDPSLNTVHKKRYIDNVHKLFNSRIEFRNNKIFTLKPYSNFRFHYFDIRYLLYKDNEIANYCFNYINNLIFPYSYENIEKLLNIQINLDKTLLEILDYYKNSDDKVITKIKKKYNNKKIGEKINSIYNELIINNILETLKMNNVLIKLLEKTIKDNNKDLIIDKSYMEIQSDIYIQLQNIKTNIIRIYLVTTDLNFLRRFLDKNYIKNTIIYTGLEHLSDISYILIKYFDFKLTHVYYHNKEIKIEDINETKNFDYITELNDHLYNMNKQHKPIQCSNLFNFPINFS